MNPIKLFEKKKRKERHLSKNNTLEKFKIHDEAIGHVSICEVKKNLRIKLNKVEPRH